MIAYIKGKLLFRGVNWAVVSVSGLGYKVMCPSRTLEDMRVDDEIELFVHTAVRENDITLYGFSDGNDMDAFHGLTSVQGIGPSLALSILGLMDLETICMAIAQQDYTSLCKAPGVGKKIAMRIVSELSSSAIFKIKDLEFKDLEIQANKIYLTTENIINLSITALTKLGFRENEARSMVAKAIQEDNFTKPEDVVVYALKM